MHERHRKKRRLKERKDDSEREYRERVIEREKDTETANETGTPDVRLLPT